MNLTAAFLAKPHFARPLALLLIVSSLLLIAFPDSRAEAEEPVATFSIVGYDPETGDLGVAVQSKFFAVGAVVPWAQAGVGAIATQAFANTTFGPRGLRLLREGLSVEETLDLLLASDSGRDQRQVGIVDAKGRSVAFTGSECQDWAGQESGPGFTAQGNILVSEETVKAMAEAFRETEGLLGDKLMSALERGQEAGGDSRGMQSAALLIVREDGGYAGFNDRYCDLRVDDHASPIEELRRVYSMWKEFALILEGYRQVEDGDFEKAIRTGREAVALTPEKGEPYYHLACYLSRAGRGDDALKELRRAVDRDPDLASRAGADPDFEPLYENREFQRLVGNQ